MLSTIVGMIGPGGALIALVVAAFCVSWFSVSAVDAARRRKEV